MPNKPVQAAGEAMPSPPQESDILAEYSKLLTLIDICTEIVGDITAKSMSPAEKAILFNAQNMTSVMWDLAHRLDKDLDAYMQRPSR